MKNKIEQLFDDNDNYIHSYTGTPLIDTKKVIPKLLDICNENAIKFAEWKEKQGYVMKMGMVAFCSGSMQ